MRTIPKRLIPLILVLAMLLSAAPSVSAALKSGVGYRVEGVYNEQDNTLTATIYVHDVKALGGRFALGFDPAVLEISRTDNLSAAIGRGERIQLTTEGMAASELLSQEKGHVMFAWYPYGAAADATQAEYRIASVTFGLKEGMTAEDFHSRTLYLYCVAEDYLGWDTSAWVRGAGLVDYSNCIAGVAPCDVAFEYPQSDRAPDNLHTVQVTARDLYGTALTGGEIQLEHMVQPADNSGSAVFYLPDGIYSCLATVPGYEEKSATVEVKGGNVYRSIQLKSLQELVDQVASQLRIGFQGEDTADHVTRDMIFPSQGEQNTTITWSSSNPNVVSSFGNVFRIDRSVAVTVTATVEKDGRTAQKQFQLTVTDKQVPATEVEDGNAGTVKPGEKPAGYTTPFTDIEGVKSWAGEAIGALYEMGVIHGKTQTQFAPNDPVSRGEYLTMMMRLFNPKAEAGPGFADVPKNSYYHDAIVLAQGLEIAQGVTKTTFAPNDSITRQDMTVLTYRAMAKLEKPISPDGAEEMLSVYSDGALVSGYARQAMGAMLMAGYLNGRTEGLAPKARTTRAEAAVFLYRVYQGTVG